MEEQEPNPRYMQGFNYGYLMAQYKPELATKLTANKENQTPYFQGFVSGKEQYDNEVREWVQSFQRGRIDHDREPGRER